MSAECLLISVNQVATPYPVYPLGAACLLAALQAKGHNASHFDILADGGIKRLDKYLSGKRFDLVGLSIRNLDTADSAAPNECLTGVVEIIHLIRQKVAAPIVLGGPAFSLMPQDLMELLGADYGVVGEGEELLPWLASEIAADQNPKKGIFRAKRSECPWRPVSYAKSISDYYIKWGGMLNIQTKRGCPYNCSYCSYPSLEGTKIRYREPEEVADEVERLHREFGAKYLFFADAVFNDPCDHHLRVAEELIKKGNTVPWCAFFRPNNLSRSAISLMKRAGLSAMEFGTDASSDKTLAGLRKGFLFADVIKTEKAAVAEKIPVSHFIIFGGPGEDEQTFAKGLANVDHLKDSVVFGCIGIRVLPGTAIHDLAISEKVITKDGNLLDPVFYYSPKISRAEIDRKLRKSWHGRFDRIYPLEQMEPRIKHLHSKGHVGPMWDFLIKK